ncbi:Acetylcholinesterase like protein [Argiope bruennichi]|uniref:Acetylcholinesterase like protein n=1 Tax=Argiope bruennichi TaxID=94029 RepID=A0A8T0EAX6_ARGBR|nr:Acetylcholinesterase like protein [Argiope bruennichi]
MIMESGSPAVPTQDTKLLNIAFTEQIAIKVGCATNRQSVVKCLKDVEAEDLERAEFETMPKTTSHFFPQYGDEFLPKNPRKSVSSGEFRCKKLLIGNNLDEGSVFVSTSAPEIFGFFGEKIKQLSPPSGAKQAEEIIKSILPDLQSTVKSLSQITHC